MMRWVHFYISLAILSLSAACSSSGTENDPKETSTDQSVTMASLAEPISGQEAISIFDSAQIRPIEIVSISAGGLQAGYVLQPWDTLDSALTSFKAKHEEFLQFMRSQLEQEAANAPTDEDAVHRTMRDALMSGVQAASEEFQNGTLRIARLRLSINDVDALENVLPLQEVASSPEESTPEPTPKAPGLRTLSLSHETWAPYAGTSQVTKFETYQTFYFNNVTQFTANPASTYEHETQIYNNSFANFSGYWASNLPSAYKDTQFLDTLDNFTMGSAQASSLATYTQYYTYMSLTGQSAPTATVRIKGQIGHRFPSWCYSTWCIFADFTSGSMATFTAPLSLGWQY